MYRIFQLPLLIFLGLCACSKKKDIVERGLKEFTVEGIDSDYDLLFNFPTTLVSVKDVDNLAQLDTTDVALNWIFFIQYENPDIHCFYDSLDTKHNVIIKAGPRVDLSNEERKLSYFTLPTVPINRVFPPESDSMKLIYDSGDKKYQEKTYRKRKYKALPDIGAFSEYYYVTTKWQSVLVIVNSAKEINMEKYILDYKVIPKEM